MTLADLRSLFRMKALDTLAPYLWEDAEIDAYINEAVNEAADRASLIYDDSTAAVTAIAVTVGNNEYQLHPSILRIDYAKFALETDDLDIIDRHERRNRRGAYIIPDTSKLVLSWLPQAADTLKLGVYRLPINPLVADTDAPEFHVKHHAKLLDWALKLGYLKPDSDAFDPQKSQRHEAEFIANFGERIDANVRRKQHERRRHVTRCNW